MAIFSISSMILISRASKFGRAFTHDVSREQIRNGGTRMRILLAALTIAFLTGTAGAQDMGGKGSKGRKAPQNAEQQKAEQQKKKAIDDAYKAAVGRIPDPKDKYDPWRNAR
jgi:hypothetical protein